MAPKVLVVLTSYGFIESANRPTGWYLPEFAHPYEVLAAKGIEVVTASPKGGVAPLDPRSIENYKSDASASSFYQTKSALWERTARVSSFRGRAGEFAALFYPGGYGPMFDLATDEDSIALVAEFVAAGKVVAAVCHGPAAFTNVVLPGGKHLLSGKEVTCYSNVEEDSGGMSVHMPFSLEDRIREAGATYKMVEQMSPLVLVQDGGKFITGQNPASSKGVGEALAKAIGV
ncbi:class I glutamine amidotransferase-like protein [Hypoxylon crocopeplum]|nr:class I glutamine amidotransferase-like protein [Hypoxylon crocopeplum]